jgi:N-acetylneuraminic acid mutarotase
MRRSLALSHGLAVAISLSACTDPGITPPPRAYGATVTAEILDGAHGGNSRFFFLSPLVPNPATQGVFDNGVSPVVTICAMIGTTCGTGAGDLIATYSMTTGPGSETVRVSTDDRLYIVNWQTDNFALDPAKHYRIGVTIANTSVGHADVDVVSSGREIKNVATGEFVPLLNGRTLPIKFRIEAGIVVSLSVSPSSAQVATGETIVFTAGLSDPYGSPVTGRAVNWSSANTSVATVDASGHVLGIAPGSVAITATSEGVTASATLTVIPAVPAIPANTWVTRAPMPTPRYFTSAAVLDGILYVVGGVSSNSLPYLPTLEAYNPATNTWTTKAPMPTLRHSPAVGAINGKLYVAGGNHGTFGAQSVLDVYDPATNTWATKAPMPAGRGQPAGIVADGRLYVIGGYRTVEQTYVGTVEAYDPATDSWSTKAAMPTARFNATAAVLNGTIYVVGGYNAGTASLRTVEAYDPLTDSWTTKAPMLTHRYAPGAAAIGGLLYVAGGFDNQGGGGMLKTLEAYDPSSNTWVVRPPMTAVRFGLGAGAINGILYTIGGSSDDFPGTPVATLEAYRP